MELTGKYVGLWMTGQNLRATIGPSLTKAGDEETWSLIGKVTGVTAGVGMWLLPVSIVSSPHGFTIDAKGDPPASVLIPWARVSGAVVWEDAPAPPKEFGFIVGKES
jgi:hypothetical protein